MDKKKKLSPQNIALTVLLSLVSLVWIYPVFNIVINSLKENRFITTAGVFELPKSESFIGIANYIESINGMDFLRSFWYSLIITVSSVCLIMLRLVSVIWVCPTSLSLRSVSASSIQERR